MLGSSQEDTSFRSLAGLLLFVVPCVFLATYALARAWIRWRSGKAPSRREAFRRSLIGVTAGVVLSAPIFGVAFAMLAAAGSALRLILEGLGSNSMAPALKALLAIAMIGNLVGLSAVALLSAVAVALCAFLLQPTDRDL